MKFSSVVRITCVAVCICVLAAGLSCPSSAIRTPVPAPRGDNELVLFFTGSELGSLRPCGCSGGQLGGLEKRSAVFGSVPAGQRLIVGTGGLVRAESEQDLMKYRILFEAFKLLGYDVVRLTGQDREIAARLGVLEDAPPPFQVLPATGKDRPAEFSRQVPVGGRQITVNFASFDSAAAVLQPPSFVLRPQDASTVNILMVEHYDPNSFLLRSWHSPGVECIICPSNSDEPQLLSKPGEVPLVFSVGRFGRYLVRLGVKILPEDGGQRTRGSLTPEASGGKSSDFKLRTSNFELRFESIPLGEKLPDDPALVQLHRQYQQLVGQSDLLERYPRIPLDGKLAFVGSASCRRCHASEYDQWKTTGHSHALETLRKVGSDRDPECVICHVTGLEYESGFVNGERTPHLTGVGCENCHGPGSQHVLTAGETLTGPPKTACAKCHTPEQSGEFAGHEEEFMKKITHGREPAAAGHVKD